jgi:hypothetical protein
MYNTEGLLVDKHIALEENFFLWHFDYTAIGALTSIDFPSGFQTHYHYLSDGQSPELKYIFDANTSLLLGSSEIDRLNQLEAIQSLPLPKADAVNQALAHMQDLLGITLLDEFEYYPLLRVMVLSGVGAAGESSFIVQLGEGNEVLSIVDRSDGATREFVYLDGVLIRELKTPVAAKKSLDVSPDNETDRPEGDGHKQNLNPEENRFTHWSSLKSGSSTANDAFWRANSKAAFGPGRDAQPRQESRTKNTFPKNKDSDNDGLPDRWEKMYFSSLARDGRGDFDGDGISDGKEFRQNSNPKLGLDGVRRRTTQSQFRAVLHHF